MRIGFGHDTHRLVSGRTLKLGGVAIESPVGPEAHSDGDVLIHAVIDALLGACSLGDIGEHFPPGDPRFKNADSGMLLGKAAELIEKNGCMVVNIDTVIHLEQPRLGPYKERIAQRISELLGIRREQVSVKAKTGEGVGPIGRGEAVSAEAAVLLEVPEPDLWV